MVDVQTGRPVGKIDWLLAAVNAANQVTDWCLLEVQAVYVSGSSLRPAFDHYMATGNLDDVAGHPDFRSPHVKRLLPQLMLKAPVIQR